MAKDRPHSPAATSSPARVLILPGIGNSGPKHWQSLWEAKIPGCARIAARDWNHPERGEWVAALESTLAQIAPLPVILVAHSIGCLQVVHWAAAHGDRRAIRGALLVAPPNPMGDAFPREAIGFAPVPDVALPFRSVVVASSDDPYASLAFSRRCAEQWQSQLIEAGPHGHINSDSALGEWPEGSALLGRF